MSKEGSRLKGQGASIVVRNLNKKFRINERFIKEIAARVLKILKSPRDIKLEIIFLSDAAIRTLNKKYKHRDAPTDVLSFDLGESGEVIISADTASRNSEYFGTFFEKELVLYVIHGILHLYGYNDGTAPQKRRMSNKENHILRRLCASTNLSKALMRR